MTAPPTTTTPEPTFNGATYAESYKIAKYERNPELAWPALLGMLELHDESNKEETVQTCIEVFRRTPSNFGDDSAVLKRMATVLESETLESMLMSEIKNGNFPSQAIMIGVVNSYMWDNKKKMKSIFESHKKENASTIIELANAEKLNPKHAAELLHSIHVHTDLDVTTLESSEAVFIAALSDSDRLPNLQTMEFAMESSGNSPEFVKAVYGLIHESDRQDSVAGLVYEKLTALKPDQLKVIVPMIPNHHYFKSVKKGEHAHNNHIAESLFELIAACGEHAVALKDDFEHFEKSKFKGEEYLKARKAVLGRLP